MPRLHAVVVGVLPLLLSSVTFAEEREPRPIRLAVYEFELSGIEPHVGRVVTDAVLVELRKLKGVSVLGMDEVRAMLDHEAEKQLLGCGDDSCLAEIADALGVDGLVMGSLARVENQSIFGMKRIDQRKAQTVGSVVKRLAPEGGEELLAAIGPAVEELFPEYPLRPGQERGVAPELALRLRPPPLPPWVFYSTAGVATGAAVLGAAVAVGFFVLQADYGAYAASGTKAAPVPGEEVRAKGELVTAAWGTALGLAGVGVVVAAIAAVEILFTDWAADADEVSR